MRSIILALLLLLASGQAAFAQKYEANLNFEDRKAIVINNAPSVLELSGFEYGNTYDRSRFRLSTSLSWKNVSDKSITAFEVVILRFDPFNRPIRGGGTWMVTGKNSGDWRPLEPGQTSGDGLSSYDSEPVMTAIAYVRSIRFRDGTVWTADISGIRKDIQARLPDLKELGDVSPEKPSAGD